MIELFTKAWFDSLDNTRAKFAAKQPDRYEDIVRVVVQMLADADWAAGVARPDPQRIHEIDDGHYQGTLVYVVGEQGYQPSQYWYVQICYGSCSGCDTLQQIWDMQGMSQINAPPTDEQVDAYMTLALHVVQGLRAM